MRLCNSVCLGRHIMHPIRHLGRPSHKLLCRKHRKECFNSHTVYNISGTVAELCDVQSTTVRRQCEKIHPLHDRISEGKQCFLSHMPQAIRTDGLSPDSCSLRQIVHERISTLGSISGIGPITSLPVESESDVRSSLGTAPVETPDLSGSRGTHGRGSSQTSNNNGRPDDNNVVRLGGIHEGRIVNGRWGQHLTNLHINNLEMLAVFMTLKHFLHFLKGHHVLVRTDNTTVVAYIN